MAGSGRHEAARQAGHSALCHRESGLRVTLRSQGPQTSPGMSPTPDVAARGEGGFVVRTGVPPGPASPLGPEVGGREPWEPLWTRCERRQP